MGIRVRGRFLRVEPFHFLAGLHHGDARLQPRDADESVMKVFGQVVIELTDRHPQVGPPQKSKTSGQDTRDGVALIVERNRAPDHTRIPAKTALPQAVAEHYHRRASASVFFRQKRTARGHADAQHREQRRARIAHQNALRVTLAGQIESL